MRQAGSASEDPGAASIRFSDLMGILEFHSGWRTLCRDFGDLKGKLLLTRKAALSKGMQVIS